MSEARLASSDPLIVAAAGSSPEVLAAALRVARAGTWSWDAVEDRVTWDEPLCAVYGVGGDEAPRTAADFLNFVHPDERLSVGESIRSAVERGADLEYEFRTVLRDGSVRWIHDRSSCVCDQTGRTRFLIGACIDVTERKAAELALRDSETRLKLAIDAARIAIWEYDVATDRIIGSPELNRLLGFPADAAPTLAEFRAGYAPGDQERVRNAGAQAVANGERYFQIEFGYTRPDGASCWLLLRAEIETVDGKPRRVIGVLLDITDERRAAERQALLVRELSHRSRNLLATVQALVSRTLNHANDLPTARGTIVARIANLATVYDLLTVERWEGARIAAIVQRTLATFATERARVRTSGPDVRLAPRVALDVSMILHELMTNATKYGALVDDDGSIDVTWTAAGEAVEVQWRERGGPAVTPPGQTGFGWRLIQGLATDLGGSADADFDVLGLSCRFSFVRETQDLMASEEQMR